MTVGKTAVTDQQRRGHICPQLHGYVTKLKPTFICRLFRRDSWGLQTPSLSVLIAQLTETRKQHFKATGHQMCLVIMQSLSTGSLACSLETRFILLFDRGQYLGKYLLDAKEKCPFVKRVPVYMGRW